VSAFLSLFIVIFGLSLFPIGLGKPMSTYLLAAAASLTITSLIFFIAVVVTSKNISYSRGILSGTHIITGNAVTAGHMLIITFENADALPNQFQEIGNDHIYFGCNDVLVVKTTPKLKFKFYPSFDTHLKFRINDFKNMTQTLFFGVLTSADDLPGGFTVEFQNATAQPTVMTDTLGTTIDFGSGTVIIKPNRFITMVGSFDFEVLITDAKNSRSWKFGPKETNQEV